MMVSAPVGAGRAVKPRGVAARAAVIAARAAARAAPGDDECCVVCPEPPLTAAAATRHAQVLKALADPQRLRMISLLAAQPADEPLCVCDIEAGFDLTQGTISHHLKVLREAGLVTVSKRGLWHYYALVPEGLAEVRALLGALTAGPAKT